MTPYGLPYFEHVSADPGINRLTYNTCRILDFELLVLKAGQSWRYHIDNKECGFDILTGTADIQINEQRFEKMGGRKSVFDGPPSMVYCGSDCDVIITAQSDVEIGIGSAAGASNITPYAITPQNAITGTWGSGNTLRHYRAMINKERPSERLWLTEVFVSDGRWATYPPHKHEDVIGDIFQEEMYFYKVEPACGLGFCGQFEGQVQADYAFIIRNNTIHKMPHGYHTVAAAPGYRIFYLAVYAGRDKRHMASPHPDHVNFSKNNIPENPL